ncbi:MAG: HAD-IIIA family hydrolase [Candidatus Limnocylindria bacterium]
MTGSDPRGRPRQAVIVAGGRGTRLGPLTEDRPKALVEVAGRPFLDHLVGSIQRRGFDRILLLLGYRAEQVQRHVDSVDGWGAEVTCVATDPADETATRFRAAEAHIDPRFLFLYCDNLWPMPFDAMWSRYAAAGASAMVTVYANDDGFTRDNVRVGDDGLVEVYDRTREAAGLRGVEIGYGIFERDELARLGDVDRSFQDALYPGLIAERRLHAWVTAHRYYSIGKPERLEATAAYVSGPPTVIVDRDGVLNEKAPRAEYVRSWAEWRWIPGALEALALLRSAGYRVIVVSNQAGIARGAMRRADLDAIHERMRADVAAHGGRIDDIYVCPHDWDEGCACRKPKPGMLLAAQRDHALDLTRTPFIGDDERDGEAAAAAGAPSILVSGPDGLLRAVEGVLADTAVTHAGDRAPGRRTPAGVGR